MLYQNDENGRGFVQRTKEWTIRHIIASFFSVSEEFLEQYTALGKKEEFPHRLLNKLSDAVYDLKEDMKLIYKPLVRSQNGNHGLDHRIEPDNCEIDFLVNIGILYHKLVVSRELKYLCDNYDGLSKKFPNSKAELVQNIDSIHELFIYSRQSLLQFLRHHSENILLITFLIKNVDRINSCIRIDGNDLLKQMLSSSNLVEKKIEVGEYLYQSGHFEDALEILHEVATIKPQNTRIKHTLKQVTEQLRSI